MLARALLPKRGGLVAAAFLRASSSTIPTTHTCPVVSPHALLAAPSPYPTILYRALSTTMKPEEDAGKYVCLSQGKIAALQAAMSKPLRLGYVSLGTRVDGMG